MIVRFYAPVCAEAAPNRGPRFERVLTRPAWGLHPGNPVPFEYPAGTRFVPVEGGLTDGGLSYVDAEVLP